MENRFTNIENTEAYDTPERRVIDHVVQSDDTPQGRGRIQLSLDVFCPEKAPKEVERYIVSNRLIPNDNHVVQALTEAAQQRSPEFFTGKRGRRLKQAADAHTYKSIQYEFGFETRDEAETFFQQNMADARGQLAAIVNFLSLDQVQPNDKFDGITSPAELIMLMYGTDDDRMKYEAARLISLAAITAELQVHKKAAQKKLLEVQKAFHDHLFTRKLKQQDLTVFHNNETNEVAWIDDGETPPEDIDFEKIHIKTHSQTMKVLQGRNMGVEHLVREKKGIATKAVIKAYEHAEKGEGDKIQPTIDVTDIFGMKCTLEGTHEDAQSFREELKRFFITHFGDELDEEEPFKYKDKTRGAKTQTGKFQAKRLIVNLKDLKLEIMIHTQQEELENTFWHGKFDPETEGYDGGAHGLVEVDRAIELAKVFFPAERYGEIDWDELRKQKLEETVHSLQQARRPDPLEEQSIFERIMKRRRE